jgi:hypothetical protein
MVFFNFSNDFQADCGPMRPGLFDAQSFHEPPVLLRGDGLRFGAVARPLEAAAFKPLVQENEPVTLPIQRFDSVATAAAKQKQGIAERIQPESLLNDTGKPVYPASEVGVSAGNVDTISAVEIIQHDFNARQTASTVAVSAPEYMSASAFPMRSVTATSVRLYRRSTGTSAKHGSCRAGNVPNTFLCQ